MKRRRRKSRYKSRKHVLRGSRLSEAQRDAFAVLSLARREGISLSLAAKAEGIRPSTVLKYTTSAWKRHGKDYRAKTSDKLTRTLTDIGPKAVKPIVARNSREASLFSHHALAVQKYVREGDTSGLRAFRGKLVPGTRRKFLTDPKTLDKLSDAGLLDFKKFYRDTRHRG